LFSQGCHVGQAIGAIGNGDSQVGEDPAGIMGVPRDPALGHRHRHVPGQPALIGQLGQPRGACMADEILPIDGHLRTVDTSPNPQGLGTPFVLSLQVHNYDVASFT